jgi:DnaJ-class molecular chaperone
MYRLAHLPPCPYCKGRGVLDREPTTTPENCDACNGAGRDIERALLELDYDEIVFYGVRR